MTWDAEIFACIQRYSVARGDSARRESIQEAWDIYRRHHPVGVSGQKAPSKEIGPGFIELINGYYSEISGGELVRPLERLTLQVRDLAPQAAESPFASEAARPPKSAHFVLLLVPKKDREHLIGDLEEEYRTNILPEYGKFWARVWYWVQAIQAIGFYVWPFVKRVLGMAAIGKVIGR